MIIIEREKRESQFALLFHLFIDPWLLMLSVGAIGHRLNMPGLFKVDYWVSFLICFGFQAVYPSVGGWKYVMKNADMKKEKNG